MMRERMGEKPNHYEHVKWSNVNRTHLFEIRIFPF